MTFPTDLLLPVVIIVCLEKVTMNRLSAYGHLSGCFQSLADKEISNKT